MERNNIIGNLIDGIAEQGKNNPPKTAEKAPVKENLGTGPLQHRANLNGKGRAIRGRVEREEARNKMASSQLQREIIEGIRKGDSVGILFLKAIKALSYESGNAPFYTQTKEEFIKIRGAILHEREPLESQFEEVQKRLRKLKKAIDGEEDIREKKLIKKAILAHEEKEKELKEALERT